jgi:archaellum component FlaC
MNINELLAKSETQLKSLSDSYNGLVAKANEIESQKQEILKEVLRVEGEIRVLKELVASAENT